MLKEFVKIVLPLPDVNELGRVRNDESITITRRCEEIKRTSRLYERYHASGMQFDTILKVRKEPLLNNVTTMEYKNNHYQVVMIEEDGVYLIFTIKSTQNPEPVYGFKI